MGLCIPEREYKTGRTGILSIDFGRRAITSLPWWKTVLYESNASTQHCCRIHRFYKWRSQESELICLWPREQSVTDLGLVIRTSLPPASCSVISLLARGSLPACSNILDRDSHARGGAQSHWRTGHVLCQEADFSWKLRAIGNLWWEAHIWFFFFTLECLVLKA